MYIMAPEPTSLGYFINPSHQSVCLHVCPLILAREQLDKDPLYFLCMLLLSISKILASPQPTL
jgi:hypothetical protein